MPRPVLVAALGVLTVALDAAVNIAFPAISAALDVSATAMQWIVLTYMVTFALALVPGGRLADRIGHARVFQSGLVLTGLAHVLCGLAPAWGWLLGARTVQGVGAALVMAGAPAFATLTTEASRRGRALSRLGLAASLGAVVGPLAGGLLVEALGWRVVYLGRLPLVVAALALGRGLVVPRALSPPARTVAAAGTDRRGLAVASAALMLGWVALFAVWLLVPYYLIDRRGLPAGWAGILFMMGPLAQAAAAPLAGRLTDRGAGRGLVPLGLALEGLGLWLTGRLDDAAGAGRIAFALGLGGFGSGLFIVANMHYVMSALPSARQGVAGSLVALMRTAGVVVGAAVTAAVYAARLAAHASLGEPGAATAAFADTFTLAAAIAGLAGLVSLIPPRPRAGRAPVP